MSGGPAGAPATPGTPGGTTSQGGATGTGPHRPGRISAERVSTGRLELVPLTPADASDMVHVLADEELYRFTGGSPPALAQLRDRYVRLAAGGPAGQEWGNWILRRRQDGAAVGYVQATITGGGREAEIAWVTGLRWQGRGYASEAALALAGLLQAHGVHVISAHIHPGHAASAAVARRAGLTPTAEFHGGERRWLRCQDAS